MYVIYIYIFEYIYVCGCVWSTWHHIFVRSLPKFTGWAIIEELSIRRRLRTSLISREQKTRVKHHLGRFIVMIWVLACNNMYRYERHLGYFYDNPTILETVSILASKYVNGPFFIEIQRQGIILAPMCLCQGKMWKSHVKNIFHIPRWPVRVKSNYVILRGVSLVAQSLTTTCPQPAVGAAKHHRQNAYLTTMFGHYVQGYFNN